MAEPVNLSSEAGLIPVDASLVAGEIKPDLPDQEIAELVMQGNIVILKKPFDAENLRRLRNEVFTWGDTTEPTNPDKPTESWHRIDDNPPQSETKHICHFYNVYLDNSDNVIMPAKVNRELELTSLPVYARALRDFQNRIAGTNAVFSPTEGASFARPQLIHYPLGGGFLGWHQHQLLPQKFGLILNVSERGVDCDTGGTRFKVLDRVIDSEDNQEVGDVTIFRYDLPHDVVAVDPGGPVQWTNERGRWTFIMPYY